MSDELYSGSPDKEARMWAAICHLSSLCGLIPLANLLVPFLVWMLKKDSHPFIDDQGREVLNFQLTITIMLIVSGILWFVLIGLLLMPLIYVYALVMTIIGAVRAYDGLRFRYPFTLRML